MLEHGLDGARHEATIDIVGLSLGDVQHLSFCFSCLQYINIDDLCVVLIIQSADCMWREVYKSKKWLDTVKQAIHQYKCFFWITVDNRMDLFLELMNF